MEIPFSCQWLVQHVTHFWTMRLKEQLARGGVWVGEGCWKSKLMKKFSLLLGKPERNHYMTPFSSLCMDALAGANWYILLASLRWSQHGRWQVGEMKKDWVLMISLSRSIKQSWHSGPVVWVHVIVSPSLSGRFAVTWTHGLW